MQVKFGSDVPNLIEMSTISLKYFRCMYVMYRSPKVFLQAEISSDYHHVISLHPYVQVVALRLQFVSLLVSLPVLVRVILELPHSHPDINHLNTPYFSFSLAL